jgi:hypothetical protein
MRPKNPRETPNPDEELVVLEALYKLTGKLLTLPVEVTDWTELLLTLRV